MNNMFHVHGWKGSMQPGYAIKKCLVTAMHLSWGIVNPVLFPFQQAPQMRLVYLITDALSSLSIMLFRNS